jgi:hypothetical protein
VVLVSAVKGPAGHFHRLLLVTPPAPVEPPTPLPPAPVCPAELPASTLPPPVPEGAFPPAPEPAGAPPLPPWDDAEVQASVVSAGARMNENKANRGETLGETRCIQISSSEN